MALEAASELDPRGAFNFLPSICTTRDHAPGSYSTYQIALDLAPVRLQCDVGLSWLLGMSGYRMLELEHHFDRIWQLLLRNNIRVTKALGQAIQLLVSLQLHAYT